MRHASSVLPALALSSALMLLSAASIRAQWSVDPHVNTPVCTVGDDQVSSRAVSDGSGGAIIAWVDGRGTGTDIYAQRLDASGQIQWTQYSAAVATSTGSQAAVELIADGSGGAIIVWVDPRSDYTGPADTAAVYAQRLNSSGTLLWTANGVLISSFTSKTSDPVLVSDGSGGAIIAWANVPGGSSTSSILAQRINSAGSVQWSAGGLTLGLGTEPEIVTDGSGGAIVGWVKANASDDIYARRVSSAGSLMWTSGGSAVCNQTGDQGELKMDADGSGGALFTWVDDRSGESDIYAQRFNSSGTDLWTSQGIGICVGYWYQYDPVIVADGSGGGVVIWGDARDSIQLRLATQRVDGIGTLMWRPDGMFITTAEGAQQSVVASDDGAGGVILAWKSYIECAGSWCLDVYAQRLDTSGTISWGLQGIPISIPDTTAQTVTSVVPDGSGGAIIVWDDERLGFAGSGPWDVYAQNINAQGYLGIAAPVIAGVEDVENDQGGSLTLMWTRSGWDVFPNTTVEDYFVWRGEKPDAAMAAASGMGPGAGVTVLEPAQYFPLLKEGKVGPGTYLRLASSDTIYWQYVGQVEPRWHSGYSYTLETPSDSGEQGTAWHYFMVTAQSANPLVFWDSQPDSGYSVDNVAPEAAQELSVEVSASMTPRAHASYLAAGPSSGSPGRHTSSSPTVICRWEKNRTDSDVSRYELHRSAEAGFTPTEATLIGFTADTLLVDPAPPEGQISYYRLLTVDIHGNRSVPSAPAAANVPVTLSYDVAGGWNLVSVALVVSDPATATIFPTAISPAYGFDDGYTQAVELERGSGYWMKFGGNESVGIEGLQSPGDTIQVVEGWNLIGSTSVPLAVGDIGSNPPGMVTSQFFGYDNGYVSAPVIEPGQGYWVKVSAAGDLYLTAGSASASSARPAAGTSTAIASRGTITIVPTRELPPPPPDGVPTGAAAEIPATFALMQNYPNPFNPSTRIAYDLPVASKISLTIFNTIGEAVATLVDGVQGAGHYEVEHDAGRLPSGVYYYRLDAGEFSAVRRMLLVK